MIQVALRVYRLQLYASLVVYYLCGRLPVWKTSNRVWDRISCKCILPLVISSQSGETWEKYCNEGKGSGIRSFKPICSAILGAIIMYEIEHEMEMWAFGTGILGGHF